MTIVWTNILGLFDLVQYHLYLFMLADGENLSKIKHLQNMNANISRMSQCSHCYRNGIAEKLLSLRLNLRNLEMLFGSITS